MKFTIQGRLPGLNDIVNSSRGNYHKANNQKKQAQREIVLQLPRCKVTKYPVEITVTFFEPSNRRDCDNVIAGGCKVICDALVDKGILIDDSRKYVSQIHSLVFTDKNNPRIEVVIE